jgi:hypothetical protein
MRRAGCVVNSLLKKSGVQLNFRVNVDHDSTGWWRELQLAGDAFRLGFLNVVLLVRKKITYKAEAEALGCKLKLAPPGPRSTGPQKS